MEVTDSSAKAIFAKFGGLAKLDCLARLKKIVDYVKVHQRTKKREYKGDGSDPKDVDKVIFDFLKGLLVPIVSLENKVPS